MQIGHTNVSCLVGIHKLKKTLLVHLKVPQTQACLLQNEVNQLRNNAEKYESEIESLQFNLKQQ